MKRQPTRNEWIAGGSALTWVILFYFPWYTFSLKGLGSYTSFNMSGQDAGDLRWLFWLLAIAIIAFLVLRIQDAQLPDLPISDGRLVLIAGGVLTAFTVLFAFVLKPSSDFSAAFGLYLSIAAAAGVTYGGFLMDAANSSPHKADGDFTSSPGSSWTPQPPPPPGSQPGSSPPPPDTPPPPPRPRQ